MYPITDTARGRQAIELAEQWNMDEAIGLLQELLTDQERLSLACLCLGNENPAATLVALEPFDGALTSDAAALRRTAQVLSGESVEALPDRLTSSLTTAVLHCCIDAMNGSERSIAVQSPFFLQFARLAYDFAIQMRSAVNEPLLETQP